MDLIRTLEQEEIKRLKKEVPDFSPGDTVVVNVNVVEGERKRLQAFEGMVIAKRNRGLNSSFIVRKVSSGEGVERTFQTYSPLIASIEVKRKGEVRRAKLLPARARASRRASASVRAGRSRRREGKSAGVKWADAPRNGSHQPRHRSSPRSAPARSSSWSTTRTARTRATSSPPTSSPREDQLPRQARPRPRSACRSPRSMRAPRPAPDGRAEPLAPRHELHRVDRGRRRHRHRHLGARSRAHHQSGLRGDARPKTSSSRACVPADRAARRRAGARRPPRRAAISRLAGSRPRRCCARSCATTAPWRGCPTWSSSPPRTS